MGCVTNYLDKDTLTAQDLPIHRNKDIFAGQARSGVLGQHPFCSDIKFASDHYQHYSEGYDSQHYNMAVEAFLFAWMASNTYEDYKGSKPEFKLDGSIGWVKLETIRTWRGLGAQVYESVDDSRVVLAFEGTNSGSVKDWIFGNFSTFGLGQYREAVQIASLAGVFDKYYFVHSDNVTEHSIYYIARGLTTLAAFHDSSSRAIADTILLDKDGNKRRPERCL